MQKYILFMQQGQSENPVTYVAGFSLCVIRFSVFSIFKSPVKIY